MQAQGRMTAEEREAYLLGRQRFEAGEDTAALEALGRVLETCPRFADVHYMVGLLHERRGALAEAESHLERALTINPGYAECVVALVSVYEQQGRFDASRALAERAATRFGPGPGPLDPTTRGKLANLHAALGDAYRQAGEPREAIEAYRKALDRAPGFHDIRYRLACTLREAGLPSQALAELRRVLRGNPGYLEAAVQLGLTWYTLGRVDRAVAEWEAVLERDPSRDDARMYLRMVRRRAAAAEAGDAQAVGEAQAADGAPPAAEPGTGPAEILRAEEAPAGGADEPEVEVEAEPTGEPVREPDAGT